MWTFYIDFLLLGPAEAGLVWLPEREPEVAPDF
jgi:hypothetical protein